MKVTEVLSRLWRIMDGEESLGWVAASRNPNGLLEMGWGVREEHRNQGLCTHAAIHARVQLELDYPGEVVMALIRPANEPSLRVARRIGMSEISRTADLVTMATGPIGSAPERSAGMVVVSHEGPSRCGEHYPAMRLDNYPTDLCVCGKRAYHGTDKEEWSPIYGDKS